VQNDTLRDDPQVAFARRARRVLRALDAVRDTLAAAERDAATDLAGLPGDAEQSARNLVHYVALRTLDLRSLQAELSELGLSSLGRAEGDVLGAVEAVQAVLGRALGRTVSSTRRVASPLGERARALFGDAPAPAVMVTMPHEAPGAAELVARLVESGMHVMRINGAHDDARAVRTMVGHLRTAERRAGVRCKVLLDLPGPKLRTLHVAEGPRVLKLKPAKDVRGRVTAEAEVLLRGFVAGEVRTRPPEPGPGELYMPGPFVAALVPGEVLSLIDARGKKRKLRVDEQRNDGVVCKAARSVYLDEHTVLRRHDREVTPRRARPLRIRAHRGEITLRVGDLLALRGDRSFGQPARCDAEGHTIAPASVSCGLPALVAALAPGKRVSFDDGKLECEVVERDETRALLRVTRTRGSSVKLRAEQGINVPDSDLPLPALTDHDLRLLQAAAKHVDMVALSFVRGPEDVRDLHRALDEHAPELGVVLKIETPRGFERLPAILLEALKRPNVAVMIARGDLAVECGFERLAEVQEEILWLCEAAHVPVIWATQVLETLAKEGVATRAEVTDAAMSERAECVMLNKGPYIVEAVRTLHDIVARMRGHQQKKASTLRPLHTPRFDG
jgi:pyruvate kinase